MVELIKLEKRIQHLLSKSAAKSKTDVTTESEKEPEPNPHISPQATPLPEIEGKKPIRETMREDHSAVFERLLLHRQERLDEFFTRPAAQRRVRHQSKRGVDRRLRAVAKEIKDMADSWEWRGNKQKPQGYGRWYLKPDEYSMHIAN